MEVEGRIFKAPETIEKHNLSSEKTLYFKYYGFWNFLKRRKNFQIFRVNGKVKGIEEG